MSQFNGQKQPIKDVRQRADRQWTASVRDEQIAVQQFHRFAVTQRTPFALDIALVDLIQLCGDAYGPSVCFQRRLFSARVAWIMFAVIDADIGMLRTLIDIRGVELQKLSTTDTSLQQQFNH